MAMDTSDHSTRTKPKAIATVVPQLFFYICIFCVYITVMMAWVLHSYRITRRSLGLACRCSPAAMEACVHENEPLRLRLSCLDRDAPKTALRTSPLALPTEESPLIASSQPVSPSCCICLDTVRPDDLVHSIPCRHVFHAGCLEFWYLYENDNCPLCQRPLLPQTGGNGGDSGGRV